MTDKAGSIRLYGRVCALKSYLEIRDEQGQGLTGGQVEKVNSLINQAFEALERRKGGRHDH